MPPRIPRSQPLSPVPFMSRSLPVFLAMLIGLSACKDPPTVDGKVQDIWGKPVEGATVQMEGAEPTTSGAGGAFSFPQGEGPIRFVAGKEGYIKTALKIMPPADPEAPVPEMIIKLYPETDSQGFFAIGPAAYSPIQQMSLKTVGTDLGAYTGLPADPEVVSGKSEFLFSSEASASELSRLNLQLHRLEFKPSATVSGVTGDVEVKINLWMAVESIKFDLTVMPKENYFLITPSEPLAPGHYAFHTQDVLTSKDPEALAKLPQELRTAYPFQIK
jgi:hypothetical protein